MQPDPSKASSESSGDHQFISHQTTSQHGLHNAVYASNPASPYPDGFGRAEGSISDDWSVSQSPSWGSTSPDSEAWLKDSNVTDEALLQLDIDFTALQPNDSQEDKAKHVLTKILSDSKSPLQNLPEETLFQIISHLPATDLLTMKVVSRRFYHLVSSPHAWMNAFSQFFPGPEVLQRVNHTANPIVLNVRSEKRQFTKLSSNISWSAEYLLRTRLLRCLTRGKPSLPFASPSPGKPGRGNATLTFASRLRIGCSNLHADFGQLLDKRKPQFIHGLASTGSVTCSDKKGKPGAWGFVDRVAFRHFSETHPGFAQWGLGSGEVVGVPNVMDVSQPHGMIYGEGTPGGEVFFLGSDDKHGRYLAPFLNISRPGYGLPNVNHDSQSVCSVYATKTASIPHLTRGLIGILSGSSNGTVTAYSLGPAKHHERRYERGQVTVRWSVSPGVPIVALAVDENYSEERLMHKRLWAVAVNALGEVYYLKEFPFIDTSLDLAIGDLDVQEEVTAWKAGRTAPWGLIETSKRQETPSGTLDFPSHHENLESYTRWVQNWIQKSPAEIRANYQGWNMQRALEVDFGGDNSSDAGEGILLAACGSDLGADASIQRYVRSINQSAEYFSTPGINSTHVNKQDIWTNTIFELGSYGLLRLTAIALDGSSRATSTFSEELALGSASSKKGLKTSDQINRTTTDTSALMVPGQRARLFAAGTSTGMIFIWNARGQSAGRATLSNTLAPVRIIQTDSPGIASLALSALYLVHGGEEGLVQAWDPLASTKHPLRTLSSRHAINNRRRVVIAAQQNPGLVLPHGSTPNFAATAICLDPDSSVLRGVVAIGGYMKYWSYSSVPVADDLSKTQKRNLRRAKRGLNSSPNETFSSSRRAGLKGLVDEELANREFDRRELKEQEKLDRRIAGRFGLDILGEGATDDELLAYAKMLSQEEHQKQALQAVEKSAASSTSLDDVELRKLALSDEELERWKFASWEERMRMSAAVAAAQGRTNDPGVSESNDLERAVELSLENQNVRQSLASSPTSIPRGPHSDDKDLDEAIARSLADEEMMSSPGSVRSRQDTSAYGNDDEDDLARAIRLSLNHSSSVSSPEQSRRQISSPTYLDETEFPALTSSSPPARFPSPGPSRSRKKKGKARES